MNIGGQIAGPDGWNSIDLVTSEYTVFPGVNQRIRYSQQGCCQGGKDYHGWDDIFTEERVDLGHDESHHQVESQGKKVVHQEQILIADTRAKFK